MKISEEEKVIAIHNLLIPLSELKIIIEGVKKDIVRKKKLATELENYPDLQSLDNLKIISTHITDIRGLELEKVRSDVDAIISSLEKCKSYQGISSDLSELSLSLSINLAKMQDLNNCVELSKLQQILGCILTDIDDLLQMIDAVLLNTLNFLSDTGDVGLIQLAKTLLIGNKK